MRGFSVWAVLAATLLGAAAARADTPPGLTPFTSAAELNAYIADHARQDPPPDECPPDWEVCQGYDPTQDDLDSIIVTGSRIPAPTITNNQLEGVDEGDIVKLWNDTLVILRRGRVFTVDISRGGLRAVDSADAYAPGVDAEGDWYDEMLVADGWVVVIGYSYDRETVEINRFRLDRRGRLTFVDSHRLTANDYYSSRNYASRLIGGQLVLYSPMSVSSAQDALADAPRLTRLRTGGREEARPLLDSTQIYRTPGLFPGEEPPVETIHAVVRCDLTAQALECGATAIVGPSNRVFYASTTHAYLWLTQWDAREHSASAVYRVPFVGGPVTMARAWGGPIDHLSFEEDPEAGVLNVLVASDSAGDGMWNSGFAGGGMALLRLPFSRFSVDDAAPQLSDYRILGGLPDNAGRIQNRFVAGHLLYSVSSGWHHPETQNSLAYVLPVDGGPMTTWLFDGGVERIEPMGNDALIVSRSGEGVVFRSINLIIDRGEQAGTPEPAISDTFIMEGAQGAETRSHAFFYRPDLDSPSGEFGILGLPVIQETERDDDLFWQSADLAFLRRGNNRLRLLGTLDSNPDSQIDDSCVASCVDWYGDARPIFIRDRIFALLGYELVEGRETVRTIQEVSRISFAPSDPAQRD